MNDQTTHASLLARLSVDGDTDAWEEFCGRYGRLIRNFLCRRGIQAADVEDVMQEVLVQLTKTMPLFRYDPSRGKFRSYLKTVTVRAASRKIFQTKRPAPLDVVEEVANDGGSDVERVWEEEWRQHHIRLAMRQIAVEYNEADRDAFLAYAVSGRGARETADSLGMSVDQVYKAKSRILKRLSELVAQQTQEEG